MMSVIAPKDAGPRYEAIATRAWPWNRRNIRWRCATQVQQFGFEIASGEVNCINVTCVFNGRTTLPEISNPLGALPCSRRGESS